MPRKRIPHDVDPAEIEDNARSLEVATFAKTLNSLLSEKGIHQKDMARALDIATGSISSYRNGEKEPRLSVIVKMADYLGVDCHYLMTGVQAKNRVSSKELGLSEGAINAIKELGESCEVLNHILEESGNLWDILDDIDRLACEESTKKVAEVSANTRIDRESAIQYEDFRDYTIKVLVQEKAEERRDVIEYRILKKFKKLLDVVVNKLTMQKEYREYGAKKLKVGYYKEVEFFNDLDKLDKEKSAEGKVENNGKH